MLTLSKLLSYSLRYLAIYPYHRLPHQRQIWLVSTSRDSWGSLLVSPSIWFLRSQHIRNLTELLLTKIKCKYIYMAWPCHQSAQISACHLIWNCIHSPTYSERVPRSNVAIHQLGSQFGYHPAREQTLLRPIGIISTTFMLRLCSPFFNNVQLTRIFEREFSVRIMVLRACQIDSGRLTTSDTPSTLLLLDVWRTYLLGKRTNLKWDGFSISLRHSLLP